MFNVDGEHYMKKICELCGDEFEAKNKRVRFCNKDHYANCPECGRSYKLNRSAYGLPTPCCSYACRAKKTAKTSIDKYGCRAPGNNPEARKKASETMMKTLGVPYAMMSKEVREKSEITMIERYGVDNVAKNPEYKMKAVNTALNRYEGRLPFNSPESYAKQHRTIFDRYGVNSALEIPHVQLSSPTRISKMNIEFQEKIEKLHHKCELEYRIGNRYFDLYVEDIKCVIELNPTYTHWMYADESSKDYDKYYHRNKSILAESAGLKCIHVWDWDSHRKILGNLFTTSTIDASELQVYKLSKSSADKFLRDNDLRGSVKGDALHLGLVKDDEVFQCISFAKCRCNKKFDIQLVRYTTKLYSNIVGGFDKLSSAASILGGISRCIAYMDYSKPWNEARLEEMNMKFKYQTPPVLVYSKGVQFYTNNVLNRQFNTVENIDSEHGWLPIYTCGSKVYTFEG